jgi:hypothetical protein
VFSGSRIWSLKPSASKYADWERLIGCVQQGMTKTEVEQILGTPSRLVYPGTNEIIAYQAGQIGNAVYSIRVVFTNDRVSQCYLGFELCEGYARSQSQKRWERFQLFLVVLGVAIVFVLYYWLKSK